MVDPNTDDDEAPQGALNTLALGTPMSAQMLGLSGPYAAMYQQGLAQQAQQQAAQQKYAGMLDQQQGPLSQTGISDLDKASLLFQAAGALGQTTRSGGFGETLGNLGTAMAGPLSKAAEAQRQRQTQLQQLQLARQKLAVEMAGSQYPSQGNTLALLKAQQDQEDEPEYKDIKLGNGMTRTLKFIGNDAYDPVSGKKIDPATFNQQTQAGPTGLSGDDYLKTIPKDISMEVQALAAGKKPPNMGSKNEERSAAVLSALRQYLGDDQNAYDNVVTGRRAQVAADAASEKSGSLGFGINSAAKMMAHVDDAAQAAGNLENFDTPMLNRGKWAATSQFGTSDAGKLRVFNTTHDVAGKETARALEGKAPAMAEVKSQLELSNPYMSPNEFEGHYGQLGKLLRDGMTPQMDKYNRVMGTNFTNVDDFLKYFSPSQAQHIDNLRDLTIKGSDKYKQRQQQQQQQQQQPSAAPDAQGWVTLPNGIKVRQKQDQ